jgi:hypothetical protein
VHHCTNKGLIFNTVIESQMIIEQNEEIFDAVRGGVWLVKY